MNRLVIVSFLLLLFPLSITAQEERSGAERDMSPEPDSAEVRADRDTESEEALAAITSLPLASLIVRPETGGWALYRLEDKLKRRSRELLIGVARREAGLSGMAAWIEVSTKSQGGIPVVLRFMYEKGDNQRGYLRRFMIKMGDHHAVELCADMVRFFKGTKWRGRYRKIETETISVQAGTFKTERARYTLPDGSVQQLWFSDKVRPFGVVRAISLTHDLELIDFGTRYEARVTDEPIRLDWPRKRKKRKAP